MSHSTRYQLLGNVIFQTVSNETVIINLENGRYYSLNPTASVIWEELVKQATTQEIARLFPSPENPDSATEIAAIDQFVDALITEDLLTPAPSDARNSSSSVPSLNRVRFDPPMMEKFTDMEELIPLDPIHQVGTLGWPYRKQDETDPAA